MHTKTLTAFGTPEEADELLCVIDGDGRFVAIVGAFEKLSGRHPDTCIGRVFTELLPPDDVSWVLTALEQTKLKGSSIVTNRYRHVDGRVHEIRWNTLWLAHAGLAFSYGRDITDMVEAQRSLHASETLLHMAGKAALFGGWSLDLKTDTPAWTDEIGLILERAEGEADLTLDGALRLFEPRSRQILDNTLARCRKEGGEFDLELKMATRRGRLIDIRILGRSELGEDGAPVRLVGAIQDISRQKGDQYQLDRLAYFDPLTGLANRRQLIDRLEVQRSMCGRRPAHAALLTANIDGFKIFNSSRGHQKGDQLLLLVAQRLRAVARNMDLVARAEGDSFVILMRDLDLDPDRAAAQARNMAARIMAATTEPFQVGDKPHALTMSIGIVLFGDRALSTEVLVHHSELALLAAKAGGGNAIRFFDPELQYAVNNRTELESNLREAIDTDDLLLHFEPQVDADGRVLAVEALVRWRHPTLGVISPANFIPQAEASGLIIPLGRHVLRRACRQLAEWRHLKALADLRVSVNVSAAEFRHPDFIEHTLAIVADSGIDPTRLTLELTESLMLNDIELVSARMHTLKALGLRFALDDFGTGYSSLAYLQSLPLDQIKLDMSFVSKLPADRRTAAIVRTIIALAKNLGLDVIAEGVETEDQRQFLIGEGCTCFQGHLFVPSQTSDELAAWLAARTSR